MKTLPIIYEDDDYVLLNKPANLLTIPDRFNRNLSNLSEILRKEYGEIYIVHRLDKETSGIICFAKNTEAHKAISLQFGDVQSAVSRVEKVYLALVNGKLQEKAGKIDLPISENPFKKGTMRIDEKKGKPSMTEYFVAEEFRNFTLVKIKLITGRTHQIRVHFSGIGNPLAVDSVYGNRNVIFLSEIKKNYHKSGKEESPLINRLTLHALQLGFFHVTKNKFVKLEAPLAKDFEVLLKQLRKNS